ncbi:hypothetical protein BO71DRAFT_435546 [Aspergillus ellipticus CBS 707.79]|uniref:Cytochrome b5 heme-binding domain-containing protein n=1 Tax=Aspergillus ellipticus CBS 707.79 TaxID=1448320 RepID=A0A319CTS6_9EURO|nr:hypothetical protein BO71DRAFT_435546 [Aspergillus ellipticus CBS 707.79]
MEQYMSSAKSTTLHLEHAHPSFIPPAQVQAADGKDGNRLWIVIDDVVYDVTDFAKQHPGGEMPFQELCWTVVFLSGSSTACIPRIHFTDTSTFALVGRRMCPIRIEPQPRRLYDHCGQPHAELMSEFDRIDTSTKETSVSRNSPP